MTPDQQIQQLQELRLKIAAFSQTLAERELTGRILRLTIETELQATMSKTEAEKRAKVQKRYLSHERYSIQLTYDKAVAEAEAESLRFALELVVADRIAA